MHYSFYKNTMQFTRAFILATLLVATVFSQTVLFQNQGTLGGLTTETFSYYTGDVSQEDGRSCYDGYCLKMDNTGSSQGHVVRFIDTTGYSDVTITAVVKTSSLEAGESCKLWWAGYSETAGTIFHEIWAHVGGSEIDWTTITFDDTTHENEFATMDNYEHGGFRFGTGQPGGIGDYCWIDSVTVTGTPMN